MTKKKKTSSRKRVCFFRDIRKVLNREKGTNDNFSNNSSGRMCNINSTEFDTIDASKKKLQDWALKHRITKQALTDLLKILISIGLTWLPTDSRTFLKTNRVVEIKTVANGKYWYNGIEKNLKLLFSKLETDIVLQLNFNIDGMCLFNSSKSTFWPILCSIHGNKNDIFRIYY